MGKAKGSASRSYQIRLTQNAERNFDEITGYIAFINRQPLNAVKAGEAILETIDRIAQNPFAFGECKEISTKTKMYRRAVCFNWLIIYKVGGEEIIILGILYKSRKPSAIRSIRKAT